MALKRNERYVGRFDNPTAAHPQGGFKNRTSPSSQDGSYLEADWANDWDGFFSRLLTVAGVTANGTVDSATSSQYYDALLQGITSSLFTSGTGISSWWYKLPNGVIEQCGLVSGMTAGGITVAYPIAFPSELRSMTIGATGNAGANNYTVATVALTPSTGNSRTHFTVSGYNTSIATASPANYTQLSNVLFYWRATGI